MIKIVVTDLDGRSKNVLVGEKFKLMRHTKGRELVIVTENFKVEPETKLEKISAKIKKLMRLG